MITRALTIPQVAARLALNVTETEKLFEWGNEHSRPSAILLDDGLVVSLYSLMFFLIDDSPLTLYKGPRYDREQKIALQTRDPFEGRAASRREKDDG